MEAPVVKIPLKLRNEEINTQLFRLTKSFIAINYQAAPTTDKEIAKLIPKSAHIWGDVSVKNLKLHNLFILE